MRAMCEYVPPPPQLPHLYRLPPLSGLYGDFPEQLVGAAGQDGCCGGGQSRGPCRPLGRRQRMPRVGRSGDVLVRHAAAGSPCSNIDNDQLVMRDRQSIWRCLSHSWIVDKQTRFDDGSGWRTSGDRTRKQCWPCRAPISNTVSHR